jgi:hypothetical protein
MKRQSILGPKRFLRPRQVFDYIAVEHNGAAVAHLFVAPQELPGLSIGYIEPGIEGSATTIGGDIEIGNAKDGSFLIDFELTFTNGVAGPLLLGDQQYDLKRGRAFVVTGGYQISQLKCQTKDDAVKALPRY